MGRIFANHKSSRPNHTSSDYDLERVEISQRTLSKFKKIADSILRILIKKHPKCYDLIWAAVHEVFEFSK